ncbi:MAG: hypothetical protein WBA89_03140 [Microcoleus sp.]
MGIGNWELAKQGIGQTGNWELAKQGIGQTGNWSNRELLANN